MASSAPEARTTVCVTGATGYIGSWLVRSLLRRGYAVHAAVRDPDMASRLLSIFDAFGQLKIFKANLYEEGSFDEAIKGCTYVFHVAAPMEFSTTVSGNIGDPKLYPILQAVYSRMGSISLVHVEDICNAHIFLMEQPVANGRYICAAGSYVMPQLEDLLSLEYPSFSAKRYVKELHDTTPPVISSKRLTDLGFKFQYSTKDIIRQSIACCEERGFLKQCQ